MKKYFVFITILALSVITINCNKKTEQETILKGNVSVFVDESLRPIIDEQVEIFESRYDGKIQLISKSENEIIQGLVKDTTKIAVLTRQLTNEEQKVFASRKIFPKQTHFATDAIVLIANINTKDTLISIEEITDFLKGSTSTKIKGLVFDNPNSSSVRYLNNLAGIKESANKNIYSFKTNEEVIK